MAYFAPYIDETGLHIPNYDDLLNEIVRVYKTIYGQDIYLDNDSMDYQQISILCRYIYDTYLSLQIAYSSRSPISAVGVSLDTLGPLFSTYRIDATKSHVNLTINGEPNTVINNGIASDENNNYWLLPASVVIPSTGIISVDCESKEYGSINCLSNTITKIVTPVFGWRSVTNNSPSNPGLETESDASYRNNMLNSSFAPSSTVLEGIQSNLMQLTGVTRAKSYENDENVTDENGIPGHNICCIVEGGEVSDIATVLYLRKAPGVGTYGTTSYEYETVYGNKNTVNFFRPTVVDIYVNVNIKSLSSYNSDYVNIIKEKLVEYLDTIDIGEDVYNSILWGVILSSLSNFSSPAFSLTSVTTSIDGSTYNTDDIVIAFNAVASTENAKINVTVS